MFYIFFLRYETMSKHTTFPSPSLYHACKLFCPPCSTIRCTCANVTLAVAW